MRIENVEMEDCKFIIRQGEKALILERVVRDFRQYEQSLHTVVDIGAHAGELSVLAAKRGAERVLAIEPDFENFGILLRNIEANNVCEQVIPFFGAVWSKMGVIRIKRPRKSWEFWKKRNSGQRSIIYKSGFPDNASCVPTITLEWLLDNLVPGHVDYLKMDIEGAEHAVLGATTAAVLKKVHFMDLDLHDPRNTNYFGENTWTSESTLEHLRKCGFDIHVHINEGKIMAINRAALK